MTRIITYLLYVRRSSKVFRGPELYVFGSLSGIEIIASFEIYRLEMKQSILNDKYTYMTKYY